MTQGIITRCFTEFASSVAIDAVFAKFTDSKKSIRILIGSALTQLACNTIIRLNEHKISASRILSSNIFAFLTGNHAQRLLHEAGHAWASTIFYNNAKPKMTLCPFGECYTEYDIQELTELGKKFGKNGSLCAVISAGPAVSVGVSTIAMAVGAAMKDRFPELGSFLIAYGRMDFAGHALYALSGMASTPSSTHDFVILKKNGINPLPIAIALIAIPLFIEFHE